MKLYFVFVLIALHFCYGCSSDSNPDLELERKLITELIEAESNAFWKKDLNAWSECWAQKEYIRTMGWYKAGGVTIVEGWKDREARTRNHMESNPTPSVQKTTRRNFNFRIYENVAWVTFDQIGEDSNGDPMDMPGISYETRILEKHDGKWKIVYAGWLLKE